MGWKVYLDRTPIASIQASLPKGPGIAPGEKSPLVAALTEPDGTVLVTEGQGRGKVLWKDLEVTAVVVTANQKGIVILPRDPRVSDGKVAHVTITVPSHPDIRAELDIPLRYNYNFTSNFSGSGGPSGILIASVVNRDLESSQGKRLSEVATEQNKDPLDALFDFIQADKGLTSALYFIASEEDLQTGLRLPWTSIGLDINEMSLDGPLFEAHTHPRGYGSMARFLGHYVGDLQLMPLEQAIRKITSLPAQREHLINRGLIKEGFFADVTIFDPATIADRATYTQPAQLSEGVKYVLVNGQLEYENGHLTGAQAGKPLKGQGAK